MNENKTGIQNLSKTLVKQLVVQIQRCLPKLKKSVAKLVKETDRELRLLGEPLPKEKKQFLMKVGLRFLDQLLETSVFSLLTVAAQLWARRKGGWCWRKEFRARESLCARAQIVHNIRTRYRKVETWFAAVKSFVLLIQVKIKLGSAKRSRKSFRHAEDVNFQRQRTLLSRQCSNCILSATTDFCRFPCFEHLQLTR